MSSRNRDFTLAGSFFVIFLLSPHVSGNTCDDTGFHPEKRGQYFRHHVIQTMTTQTASLCRIMCHLQESCISYNYQPTTGSCELSNSDETKHPDDLVPSPDFDYVRRGNPCDKNPCPAYHVCKPNLKEGSHSCSCPPGFEGPNCNQDINECMTGKHDCPSGSECINSEGSFTCGKIQEADGLENSIILNNHGNSSYLKALSGFLAPVLQNPSTSRWVRCWHAASDGWDVTTTFHPQCDGKGPTVTIFRIGKYVFGGYTKISWHSNVGNTKFRTTESFLFSLFNVDGYEPVKLGLRDGPSWISFGGKSSGPSFGYDLKVNRRSYLSSVCSTYECLPGCYYRSWCRVFGWPHSNVFHFRLDDVEVFFRQEKVQ